jgi:DNA sulfur modification protein DndC
MEPLLDYREGLAETQTPERKHEFRNFKRRDGKTIVKDGRTIPGPYWPRVRQKLLKDLLLLQKRVREETNNYQVTLITPAELHEIRRIWRSEESDWADTVPQIYREVTGEDLNWVEDEGGAFTTREYSLIEEECARNEIPTQLVARLIDLERQMQGVSRRSGIYNEIHRIFDEEWGSETEVLDKAALEIARQMELGLS